MYAVIATGGKQYRVQEGDLLKVEKLDATDGAEVSFDALMVGGESPRVGTPVVEGVKVSAQVVRQGKGPKIYSYKKWEGGWDKIRGHRQLFTELKITGIKG